MVVFFATDKIFINTFEPSVLGAGGVFGDQSGSLNCSREFGHGGGGGLEE
jgi:hypothetical protein